MDHVDPRERPAEPLEVLLHPERLAAVDADDLVSAVAELEAAVLDRHPAGLDRQVLPIQVELGHYGTHEGMESSFMVRSPGRAITARGTVLTVTATVPMSPLTPPRIFW
jgi:hypothetical protein